MALSPRLEHILGAVGQWAQRQGRSEVAGLTLADIGSDHALIAVESLARGFVYRAIVTDVAPGPLARARQAIDESPCSSRSDVRLGSGLQVLEPGEADVVVIAGMGGREIAEMLRQAPHVVAGLERRGRPAPVLVLQPMTQEAELRSQLFHDGYWWGDERLVREGTHFYHLVVVHAPVGIAPCGDWLSSREAWQSAVALLCPQASALGWPPDPANELAVPLLELGLVNLRRASPLARAYARRRFEQYGVALRSFDTGGGANLCKRRELARARAAWETLLQWLSRSRTGI